MSEIDEEFVAELAAMGLAPNEGAAAAAASCACGGAWLGPAPLGLKTGNARVKAAAAFLRTERTATPAAIVIHLRRLGFADVPEPKGRLEVAWRVFTLTLNALDRLDFDIKAAAEATSRQQEAARPHGAPRDQLANLPPDRNPLTQIGRVFSASRSDSDE